jgi:hypothetical protein
LLVRSSNGTLRLVFYFFVAFFFVPFFFAAIGVTSFQRPLPVFIRRTSSNIEE